MSARAVRVTAGAPASQGRDEAVDLFRGLAILLMVLVNYLAGVSLVPGWLKHAPDVGLTIADLVAPFFILAIGLTYGTSLRRRVDADGVPAAIRHAVGRYLGFLGIGAILSAGERLFGQGDGVWGVLQAIGVAGLLSLPLAFVRSWLRAAIGLSILAAYQVALDRLWLSSVVGSAHGGILGSLAWAAMLILGTVLADQRSRDRGRLRFALGSAATLAGGLLVALVAPISKNRVSASYVLASLGAGGLLFALIELAVNRARLRVKALVWWGANPLLLYLAHELLLGIVVLPGVSWWYAEARPLLVACQALALLAMLTLLAWFAARRRLQVTL